jgi:hypothetical protein
MEYLADETGMDFKMNSLREYYKMDRNEIMRKKISMGIKY